MQTIFTNLETRDIPNHGTRSQPESGPGGDAVILSLPDAVEWLVRDGLSIAMEGFTHLIPFGAAHEVIRQGRRHLGLIRMTPRLIYDQMIGMGCADRLIFSWGGHPGVGSLHRLRDAIENGNPAPISISSAWAPTAIIQRLKGSFPVIIAKRFLSIPTVDSMRLC